MTEYERPGGGSDHGLTIEETSYEGEPVGKRREEEQEQWHREGQLSGIAVVQVSSWWGGLVLSHAGCLRAEMLEWARVTRQLLGGDSGFVPTEAAGHRNFLLEGLCCLKQRSSGR